EALHRAGRLWRALAPEFTLWQGGREELRAWPDAGQGLNAYYDRVGLRFFHDRDDALRSDVYACESVDVACHEEGHAVLDALRPDLWDAAAFEVAAFHEAFGDVSAILVALWDPRMRAIVARETQGALEGANDVSRLAE